MAGERGVRPLPHPLVGPAVGGGAAVARRCAHQSGKVDRHRRVATAKPVHLGDLTIDPARREVRLDSRTLDLRTQEFDLLLTFASHRGLVLSREQILQKAWGFDFYGQTRTVDVHIAQLRKNCPAGDLHCRRKQRQALLHWAYDSRKM